MYAVFQSGGKQHRVVEGQTIRVEKLNTPTGESIDFDQVLMVVNDDRVKLGSPLVLDTTVQAQVVAHGRDEKIKVIKFQRRKHYRRHQGHRQSFTDIKITSINTTREED
jgi:large subunit ribosomal protein L21